MAGFNYDSYKKIKSGLNKSVLFKIVVFLVAFLMIFLVAYYMINLSPENDYFNQQSIYYLSLTTAENVSALQVQDKIKKEGGAGFIYNEEGKTFIIGFGYFSYEDALKVSSTVKENFGQVAVKQRLLAQIRGKIKNVICADEHIKMVYKFCVNLKTEIYNLCSGYDKGDISLADVYKRLIYYGLVCDKYLEEMALSGAQNLLFASVKSQINIQLTMLKNILKQCENQVFRRELVDANIKFLFLSVCEAEFSFRQELNKI